MPTKYTAESLKETILALEIRQAVEEKQLRAELFNVYENLKPINILKNIARDAASNESLKIDFTNTLASLFSGFISRKIIIGKSKNPFLRLIGVGIQLGMTTLVSKNYGVIKDFVANFISNIQEKVHKDDTSMP
jgi:hypothetical protein